MIWVKTIHTVEGKESTFLHLKAWRRLDDVNGPILCVPGTGSWYTLSLVVIDDNFLDSNIGKSSRDKAVAFVIVGIHA